METRTIKITRIEGMRRNGVFGNKYDACLNGNFFGRKYDIKGIYSLVRANSNEFIIDEEVQDDLRRYEEMRVRERRIHEGERQQKLLKSRKGLKRNEKDSQGCEERERQDG